MKVNLRSIRHFCYNVKHMKVYIPAIEGHIPHGIEIAQTFQAFMEFCYISHFSPKCRIHNAQSLAAPSDAVELFHKHRAIFTECGVQTDGSHYPRQHSPFHYPVLIRAFGAPHDLCSSTSAISESQHIKAVKDPSTGVVRTVSSSCPNQSLDKLAASRIDFTKRDILNLVK